MFSSHRSIVRAASLVVILLLVGGCAVKTPAAGGAVQAFASPAPTVAPKAPAVADAPTPAARVAPTDARPIAVAATSTPGAGPQAAGPRFGPAWGDRDVYEPALVASERKVLDGLAGASEYRIDMQIADDLTRVSGEQQVYYTNREDEPLNEIYLRLFPNALGGEMRVLEVTVDGVRAASEYQYKGTALRVPLTQPLPAGESVVIGLKYEIDIPQSLDTGYGLLSYTDGILALDTPYAAIPVYDDQGWNVETPPENADTSFNDASFYLVRVTAPAELTLVATGVEVGRDAAGDQQVVTYAQGPGRDFFVAASRDYVVSTRQVGETQVNAYARPGEEAAQQVALDAAAKSIEIYGERLGPYPYTELDVAATPMLALGIEYPGTVGISERIYDSEYKTSSGSGATIIESTVAHELAHQWFYNLVGNDQQDEPWLDEALAQYSTWLYYVDRYGVDAGEAWRASWGSRWDRSDREKKPVGLPAEDYTAREYGAIVYGRGPMFVSALAERMGQAKFDQFLKDYSARFRWGIATAAEFKALANEACGCDLGDVYRDWLDPSAG